MTLSIRKSFVIIERNEEFLMKKKYYKVFLILALIITMIINIGWVFDLRQLSQINEFNIGKLENQNKISNEVTSSDTKTETLDVAKKEETPNLKAYFNHNNLLEKSNVSIDQLKTILKDTGLSGLEHAYINAEEETGVNAIFLIALTAEESAWGRSNRAKKDNNMSGYKVYTASSKGESFKSKEESILTTANLIKKHYLSDDGNYYHGKTIYDVNKNYCTTGGYSWSNNIIAISKDLIQDIHSL